MRSNIIYSEDIIPITDLKINPGKVLYPRSQIYHLLIRLHRKIDHVKRVNRHVVVFEVQLYAVVNRDERDVRARGLLLVDERMEYHCRATVSVCVTMVDDYVFQTAPTFRLGC